MNSRLQKGHTLVELLIYTTLLVAVSFAVVASIITTQNYLRQTKEYDDLRRSGLVSLERITRLIQNASSVDAGASTFNTHPGKLVLAVPNVGAGTDIFEISTSSARITLRKNGGANEDLTGKKISVSNLLFRNITTTKGSAVRVEITLTATSPIMRSETFTTTAVLRGSY